MLELEWNGATMLYPALHIGTTVLHPLNLPPASSGEREVLSTEEWVDNERKAKQANRALVLDREMCEAHHSVRFERLNTELSGCSFSHEFQ